MRADKEQNDGHPGTLAGKDRNESPLELDGHVSRVKRYSAFILAQKSSQANVNSPLLVIYNLHPTLLNCDGALLIEMQPVW